MRGHGLFRLSLLAISLGVSLAAQGYPPTPNDIFSFAANWRETGYSTTQLLELLEGDLLTATPTPTFIKTPTRTATRTSTPTPTSTATPVTGPVINTVSPGVVDVGGTVTITGTGFGNGTHVVDVGGTQVTGAGNDTRVTFTMPTVAGMNYDIHCVEIRVITATNGTSTAGGLVYPSRVDQTDNASLLVEDARYIQTTRRFELDVAIKNQKVVNGKPYAMCSPVAILYGVLTYPSGRDVGTDNDSRNSFISGYPSYDYRTVAPAVSSPAHRLETGETTATKTWIMAADDETTHAFSMAVIASQMARPLAAHAADIYTTEYEPRPYGLGFDPNTNLLHVSGEEEGWLYGVDVTKVEEIVAAIINPGKGPSYVDVSPAGSDPGNANGRIWFSMTRPDLASSENVIGAFDAKEFVGSTSIVNIPQTYVEVGSITFEKPRGIAYDSAAKVLYVAEENTVTGILLGSKLSGFQLSGIFNDIQGLAVDPGTGALFAVNHGTSKVTCIRGLWSSTDLDDCQVVEFGGPGSAVGKFTDPRGIEVDEKGLVFVVDRGNDRVQVLDGRADALDWLMMFGGHQEAVSVKGCTGVNSICPQAPADGFNDPGDVESTGYKTVWVSDSSNWRVVQWEHDTYKDQLFPYAKSGDQLIHSNQ